MKPVKKRRKSKKVAIAADHAHYILPFVHFQQTMICEKLKTMLDKEAAAVKRHIEDTYANTMKL